ncbi:MAG: NADH:flavin oxidoreductase/NADH oxidase family protein [Pseudomonadota bacterium]
MDDQLPSLMFQPLRLPCGVVLKNRIAKSAMSDSLGDGRGNPTAAQLRLYERWAQGGLALSVIGEVQGDPTAAEKPGNLVLRSDSDLVAFETLARRGVAHGAQLWLQLGHAGAMTHPPIGEPRGPSAIDVPGLTCRALTRDEIVALPSEFARTASLAKDVGFGGIQIHAAHGFLLGQFLSPLFNKRTDAFGGPIDSRMKLLMDVINEVRRSVGPHFPISIKLNATDQLEGGFDDVDSSKVIAALDQTSIDLIDISGGTYFPGAKSASDASGGGPHFLSFAERARRLTTKPLMVTGGFKTLQQVTDAVANRGVDVVGLARALALDPDLPNKWRTGVQSNVAFPRFQNPPEGGVTAWFTMRLTELGEDRESSDVISLESAIRDYQDRDRRRISIWNAHFGL